MSLNPSIVEVCTRPTGDVELALPEGPARAQRGFVAPLAASSLRRFGVWALVPLATVASACSDAAEDDRDGSAYLADAVACGAAGHEPCDILAAECRERLAAIAACQWGGPGTEVTLPPVNVLTRDMLREGIDAQLMQAPAAATGVAAIFAALALLELVPAASGAETVVDATTNLVLAQYDPVSDQINLIADAMTGDWVLDNIILFHELVHAQQAVRYDLQRLLGSITTLDSLLGIRSLFEGEAQFHQNILEAGIAGETLDPVSYQQRLDAARVQQDAALFADPARTWATSLVLAPYIYGPYTTLDAWLNGGPRAMAERYASPSRQSLRMLELALGLEPTSDSIEPFPSANIFAAVGESPPMAGDEQYPVGTERLGAWTVYVLAQLASHAEAVDLALGWRGDQLDVFELDAGGYAGRWRVRFDSVEHANTFASLLLEKPNADVRTAGAFLVTTLLAEGETPEWLFQPLGRP